MRAPIRLLMQETGISTYSLNSRAKKGLILVKMQLRGS